MCSLFWSLFSVATQNMLEFCFKCHQFFKGKLVVYAWLMMKWVYYFGPYLGLLSRTCSNFILKFHPFFLGKWILTITGQFISYVDQINGPLEFFHSCKAKCVPKSLISLMSSIENGIKFNFYQVVNLSRSLQLKLMYFYLYF